MRTSSLASCRQLIWNGFRNSIVTKVCAVNRIKPWSNTILRRMPDYVNYICPQFSETHVNFQRVPVVDTSNPFSARHIPSADESMLIIRFRDPRGVDFPLFAFDAGGQLHVESKYHCLSGRKDAACDAAHFHADNLEVDRSQASDNGEIVRQATDWSSKPPIWRVLKLLAL
jgi:hypothetical protein